MRNAIARLLRWLRLAVTTRRVLGCPHCGEDRLVERERDGGGYCAVCGRMWIGDTDEAREPRRLSHVMGRAADAGGLSHPVWLRALPARPPKLRHGCPETRFLYDET